MTTLAKRFAAALILGMLVGLIISFVAAFARASSTPPATNSFGAVIDTTNPYVYMFGKVNRIGTFKCGKSLTCTSVQFQPYKRPLLYPEGVTFCGNYGRMFNDVDGVVIVTYARRASLIVEGGSCHRLENVYELPKEEIQ